jgi:CO dehydrogenase nickel-insertion accessory protein CooC1
LTAKRILELVGELNLNIAHTHAIINRFQGDDRSGLAQLADEKGIDLAGVIRYDGTIAEGDVRGYTVFSLDGKSVALQDAYRVFKKTL